MAVIEVKNLKKNFKVKLKEKGLKGSLKSLIKSNYKVVEAVKGVSFEVQEGEVIAFIGPNGAGKSTTIKMLTGILYPDCGDIRVLGIDPTNERKKLAYEIGTVFGQKEQLWMHLTPYDNFKFFGAIYDIPDDDALREGLQSFFHMEKSSSWDAVIPVEAVNFLDGYVPKLAGNLRESVLEKTRDVLRKSMLDGSTLQERMKALRDSSPELSRMTDRRIEAIARTEITRADTYGRLISMKKDDDVIGVEFSAIDRKSVV